MRDRARDGARRCCMVSNRNGFPVIASAAVLLSISLVVACGSTASEDVTADVAPLAVEPEHPLHGCPSGWVDPRFVQIDCIPGYVITPKVFGGRVCVRCLPEYTMETCELPWVSV